jgi:hypothetical protein
MVLQREPKQLLFVRADHEIHFGYATNLCRSDRQLILVSKVREFIAIIQQIKKKKQMVPAEHCQKVEL